MNIWGKKIKFNNIILSWGWLKCWVTYYVFNFASTVITRYKKQKITGTVIKNTMVSQACFTKTWYSTLVYLGNGWVFLCEGSLGGKVILLSNRSQAPKLDLFDSVLFLRAGGKKLYWHLSHGPTTAKCWTFSN